MKPNLAKILNKGFRTKHTHLNHYTIYTKGDLIILYDSIRDEIGESCDLEALKKGEENG